VEHRRGRGRLKIFFGYAAGVGKTYAMLDTARERAQGGEDVVAGYIEPHTRPETTALLQGLEWLPARSVAFRGLTLQEFDLDALLARRPQLALVDELAHTNAPGSRHGKRWQDVAELLDAGIDVWTTVNVQHIESLNDVVAQITGVVVRETVPDEVFDDADEIELIDLPPDDLLQRLREGKVYAVDRAGVAMEHFFRLPNLIALRELALRRSAERVNRQVLRTRPGGPGTATWPTAERLVACVGPTPASQKVIRAAKRMSAALHAEWIALHVAGPELGAAAKAALERNLRLAEELGAETASISGESVAAAILDYARSRNASKILIAKTGGPHWYRLWRPSLVDALIAGSGDIDVYVIRGSDDEHVIDPPRAASSQRAIDWRGILGAVAISLAGLAVALGMDAVGMAVANVIMVLLLAVIVTAVRLGRTPSIVSAVIAVLVFDVFFTEPRGTFSIEDPQYIVTFFIMLLVALTVSTLASRLRERVDETRQRERRTEALYRLSRRLSGTSGSQLLDSAVDELQYLIPGHVAVFVPGANDALRLVAGRLGAADDHCAAAAQWVYAHGHPAGMGTQTLADLPVLLLPLRTPEGTLGVLAIEPASDAPADVDRTHLLETFASQIALALGRDRLAAQAQRMLAQAETERQRSALLTSVSHDLRTPLAVIAGASSSLLQSGAHMDASTREGLLRNVVDEAKRMARLVDNLLDMTRIESGAVAVKKEWTPIEEVVGSALGHLDLQASDHSVRTEVPGDLPLAPLDGVLIEQVLINLVDNAFKYSPPGTTVTVGAHRDGGELVVEVSDEGPGFAPDDLSRAFDKFYRAKAVRSTRGSGLGLAICAAIVLAHGGRIWAENRAAGGARLSFSLPLGEEPEVVVEDEMDSPRGTI